MKSIPKIAYFYWGGRVLPYLRYMALFSFKKYNPDWKVVLFVPRKLVDVKTWITFESKEEIRTEDYSNHLSDLGIDIVEFDFEKIGFSNDLPEVIKSDILRLYLLSTGGGLWSDTDILYFEPVSCGRSNCAASAHFCYQGDLISKNIPFHSIGFLSSCPSNRHFRLLFDKVVEYLDLSNYQSVGSLMYNKVVDVSSPDIHNISMSVVYPCRVVKSIFEKPSSECVGMIKEDTIGFHFYGGHPIAGKWQNIITRDSYTEHDNIVCWLLRKIEENTL